MHRKPEFVGTIDSRTSAGDFARLPIDPATVRSLGELHPSEQRADTKLTNPKDIIGSTKLDIGLVPDSAIAWLAVAFTEGALKYGRYNFRIAGVRASIYHAAARRHLAKWWNGEWADPKTQVPHLASVMACCAILLDAQHLDKLNDDRPPAAPDLSLLIDGMMADAISHLQQEFADHNPHQYTIADEA